MKHILTERFRQIVNYNPSKGIINEGYGDVDTSNYICIGEIPYYPWGDRGDREEKVYIMVSPEKVMKYGKMVYDVRYCQNSDGSGLQDDSIPSYYKRQFTIYPEHQDDEYGEIFMGKKKDDSVLKEKHKEFVSKLFKLNGDVVLHHNTSYKITDGNIRKGEPNRWSNNTDIGIYFWGSRNSGSDPSGASAYTYYCLINNDELYDFETNAERMTLEQAMHKYKYVGQFWKGGEAIVVTTHHITPIFTIMDKQTGKWYDSDWNEMENPFDK